MDRVKALALFLGPGAFRGAERDVWETAWRHLQRARTARRERRLEDARRDAAEAVRLCREAGGRRELIEALKGLGQIERDLGHCETALPLYEEAAALCREESDSLLLAHTVRHVGDIHRELGRSDLAEPCYREALALYRAHAAAPTLDLANAVRPMAILEDEAGRVEEARRLWAEARDLYAAADVREGVAETSRRLARLNG